MNVNLAKIARILVNPVMIVCALTLILPCFAPFIGQSQLQAQETEDLAIPNFNAEDLPPADNAVTNTPELKLQGTKETDYLEQVSPYKRTNRYLRAPTPHLAPIAPAPLSLDQQTPAPPPAERNKTLHYNEIEVAFGTHNHLNANALINKYFNDDSLTLKLEADYANAFSQLTENRYSTLPNSELVRILFEQTIALNHFTHLLTFKHLTQSEGLQAFNFQPSTPLAPTYFRHLLFINTLYYTLQLPFESPYVEELTLVGEFQVHYGQHFLTGDNTTRHHTRHQFTESQFFTVDFTKNSQHRFTHKLGLEINAFTTQATYDILTYGDFAYQYNMAYFTLELGLAAHYRLENTRERQRSTILPLLPQLSFTFRISKHLELALGLAGIAAYADLATFYELYSPLVFENPTFSPLNRYFRTFVTLTASAQPWARWELSFVNDIYLSTVEVIALASSNLSALAFTSEYSAARPYYTLGVTSALDLQFSPYIKLNHTLTYTAAERKDLNPTVTSYLSVVLGEPVLNSALTLTHLYTFEDLFSVVGSPSNNNTPTSTNSVIVGHRDRSKHDLSLRYEVPVFTKETAQVSLFIEANNLITAKNYKNIPYLKQSFRALRIGVRYMF